MFVRILKGDVIFVKVSIKTVIEVNDVYSIIASKEE